MKGFIIDLIIAFILTVIIGVLAKIIIDPSCITLQILGTITFIYIFLQLRIFKLEREIKELKKDQNGKPK